MRDRTERYSTVAIWFHWTIAAFVIVNLAIGLLHESLFDGVKWVMPLHKSIGLTVLVLTVGRIAWRLAHRPPPLPADVSSWERGAAHAAHWGLYTLLFLMPLTGWMLSSGAKRGPLEWFGLFPVPYLPIMPDTAKAAHNAHGLLGWIMLALVVIHIAAALRHHLILRDRMLGRMAPIFARR